MDPLLYPGFRALDTGLEMDQLLEFLFIVILVLALVTLITSPWDHFSSSRNKRYDYDETQRLEREIWAFRKERERQRRIWSDDEETT